MSKYNYDQKILKGLSVTPFLKQVKTRQTHIEMGKVEIPLADYNPNILATKLHPNFLLGKINKIMDFGMVKNYVIEPFKEAGFIEFPPFKAGQYVSFEFDMGDKYTCRSYSLNHGSKLEDGTDTYLISVSDHGPGHMSAYIYDNWQEGSIVCFSAPVGKNCYEPLRDAKNVMAIGIAGETLAMVLAVANGEEAHDITAISIVPDTEHLVCKEQFERAVATSNGKVHYVPVLLNGEADDCEKGPITAELIKKYITDSSSGKLIDTTFFITGPENMVLACIKVLEELGIPRRRIRREIHGVPEKIEKELDYPKELIGKTYNLRVWVHGKYIDTTCPYDKTLLCAIEDANIHIGSDCRSGECGWCHSRLIKGEYYMPKLHDGRREADRKFGWIHPCCTYPLSDIEIEVFPSH